jgi:glyoxylase-like metal-dependent hydrolase (beta-lactamase superfamily II)
MKMNILNGGLLRMKRSVYFPEAEKHEMIDLPVSSVLLRHSQGNVLFDTGCHPQALLDPSSRWGSMAKALQPVGNPEDHVLNDLSKLGLHADDIDVVINSHFHSDHCGCNQFFRKATILCHRKELEAAQSENAIQMGYFEDDWCHTQPIHSFDQEHDVFGDQSLCLMPLPGHTPGTLGAFVTTRRSGSFLLVADALAIQKNYEHEIFPKNTWNPNVALQSLREVQKIEQQGATIIFGHDLQQWHGLKKGVLSYE